MRRRFILCDIDHVLSNAFWRDPMIGGEGGWDAYHQASEDDEPCHDMVEAINAFYASAFETIGLTARPEKWRELTMRWMVKHEVNLTNILMRADTNFRPAPELKMELALDFFGGEEAMRENVMMVLDDRDDVTEAFRAIGITVLQVHARRI